MSELYVVFSVAETEYALPAALVRQLESYSGATRVPGTAPHVAGIIQVRGQVIPVIELRKLFGFPGVEATLDTRVVIVEHGDRQVALVVDKSRDVLRIDAAQVQIAPGLVNDGARGFFAGLVQIEARLIMLLDVSRVVGEEDLNVEFSKRLEPGSRGDAQLPDRTSAGSPGNDGGATQGG
jgi:purine-binding chemotaxis protein CheW